MSKTPESFGLRPTGLPEVDRKIVEVVADEETTMSTDVFKNPRLKPDLFLGTVVYESGVAPFTQTIVADPEGNVDHLHLTKEGERDLSNGYRDKARKLWEERLAFRSAPDDFPIITGWQLGMTWGYYMEMYRGQRVEALYPSAIKFGSFTVMEALREDPIVVISPVILESHLKDKPHGAWEILGMFGRYNRGDIVPAQVDLGEYPYMEELSFEDGAFMQAVVDDFIA